MSIASRITSIEGHIEEDYNALERLGADLTNVDKNIENIASVVNDIYDKLPKVTGTGSDLSLTPTLKGGLNILPLGNCEQTGTPTPNDPIDVKVVTGDNEVVVQNKNLVTGKVANVYISVNGSFSSDRNYDVYYAKIVEGETYTIKTDEQNLLVYGFYENKPILTSITYDNTRHLKTDDTTIVAPITGYIGFRTTSSFTEAQCEIGYTSTSYVAHQEQSTTLHSGSLELCKIGDYQDVITGTKDNWKVEKKTTKFTIDNNITMTDVDANGKRRIRISVTNILRPSSNGVVGQILCSHYLKKSSNQTYLQNQGISIDATGDYIYIYDSRYNTSDTMETLKTWLIENNVTIIFVNATSTETPITDTSLVQSLNELNDLMSYDGTTNVMTISPSNNAQMLVQVSALKGE